MSHTNNIAEQTTHGIGSLNQGTPIINSLNNPTAGVAAADGVAQVEQDTQGPAFQPEPAALYGQGEVIPALVSPHAPLLVPGHVAPVASVQPTQALVPTPALPVAPIPDFDLDVNPNPNPAQSTLMASFQGVGGIQFADEVPENLAAEVPAGQNVQGPVILLEHAMPDEAALLHAPFVQLFAPVQAMPTVAAVAVAQPFVPVANNDPAQQPLLRSLYGFEGIQFEEEGEDEDH